MDLGGTAVNYTFADRDEKFLLEGLCEYPARSREGPLVCLQQIADGLRAACDKAEIALEHVVAAGLDTPGPASAAGVLSAKGSTNFVHPDWGGFDIRAGLEEKLGLPVTYLNDGNAGALWGHFVLFGATDPATSVSAIIGTGLGGGVIVEGNVITGRRGFGGELGHVLIPWEGIEGLDGESRPICNCGRTGDLESLCSLTAIEKFLLPLFLPRFPRHELAQSSMRESAKRVRGLAERGDEMCRQIFRVQAHALGLFFDEMINTFDPDALIVGGGAIETGEAFQHWFVSEIRAGMPVQRQEQSAIPIHIMPNGDTAGSRGAAVQALRFARRAGLIQ